MFQFFWIFKSPNSGFSLAVPSTEINLLSQKISYALCENLLNLIISFTALNSEIFPAAERKTRKNFYGPETYGNFIRIDETWKSPRNSELWKFMRKHYHEKAIKELFGNYAKDIKFSRLFMLEWDPGRTLFWKNQLLAKLFLLKWAEFRRKVKIFKAN